MKKVNFEKKSADDKSTKNCTAKQSRTYYGDRVHLTIKSFEMIKLFSFNDICMVKIFVVAVGVGMTLDLKDKAKKKL